MIHIQTGLENTTEQLMQNAVFCLWSRIYSIYLYIELLADSQQTPVKLSMYYHCSLLRIFILY